MTQHSYSKSGVNDQLGSCDQASSTWQFCDNVTFLGVVIYIYISDPSTGCKRDLQIGNQVGSWRLNHLEMMFKIKDIPSTYALFPYIRLIFLVSVGKYTIHTWYGKDIPLPERDDQWHWKFLHFPLLEHLNLVICSRVSLQGLMRTTWLLYHCRWFIGVGVEHPFCSYNVTISKGILLSISASQAQWERL